MSEGFDFHLNSKYSDVYSDVNPCINGGFNDDGDVVDASTITVPDGGNYKNAEIIELRNDGIPRLITNINGNTITFVPELDPVPAVGTVLTVINWASVSKFEGYATPCDEEDLEVCNARRYHQNDAVAVKVSGSYEYRIITDVVLACNEITLNQSLSEYPGEDTPITSWSLANEWDIDGQRRVIGNEVDIGVDEFMLYKVDAGQDKTATTFEPIEMSDASVSYAGPGGSAGFNVQWQVV